MSHASARSLFFLVAILFLTSSASVQDKLLTLDDIYDPEKRVNFNGAPPYGLTWLDDRHYLEGNRKVNAVTGEATPFFDAAKNLNGKMLLIHGAIDDNVHIQNSIQFIYVLQKADKQFKFMIYPRSRHGFTDPLLVRHMREMMLNSILENL